MRAFLVLFSVITICSVSSQTADELVAVTATGYGRTARDAEKDALQAAVQKAVGVFVSSEVMVQNEDVINDTILTASNGIVKDYKADPPGKNAATGQVEVTVHANVLKKVLMEKLDAAKISYTVPVQGQSLFAEALTTQNKTEDAKTLVDATFRDLYDTNLGKLFKLRLLGPNGETGKNFKPLVTNLGKDKVTVSFYIEITYDFDYFYDTVAPRWLQVFQSVAEEKLNSQVWTYQPLSDPFGRIAHFDYASDDPLRPSPRFASNGFRGFTYFGTVSIPMAPGANLRDPKLEYIAKSQDKNGSSYQVDLFTIPEGVAVQKFAQVDLERPELASIFDRLMIEFFDQSGSLLQKLPYVNKRAGFRKTSNDETLMNSTKKVQSTQWQFINWFIPMFGNLESHNSGAQGSPGKYLILGYSATLSLDDLKDIAQIRAEIQ